MTEIALPPALRFARSGFKYIDQTGITRGIYSGAIQTTGYGGDRVGVSLDFTPTGGASAAGKTLKAQLQSFLMSLRGQQNRVFIADESNVRRGSFPATELFTNFDFSNGTTGWNTSTGALLTASDGIFRLTAPTPTTLDAYQQPTVTLYAPYVLRGIYQDGTQTAGIVSIGPNVADSVGGNSANNLTTTRGYLVAAMVPLTTTLTAYLVYWNTTNGYTAGAYVGVPFASLSRCFLADSGLNSLLQSEAFATSWTTSSGGTGASIVSNNDTAPDGLVTGDVVHENSSTSAHYTFQGVTVASAGADISVSCAIRAKGRTWAYIQLQESTGSQLATAWINLSTGALGSVTTSGVNWTNVRSTSTSLGNTWYGLNITAKKTSAATTITVIIGAATADLNTSYLGTNIDSIALWRATFAASSVPTRLVSTTTVTAPGTSQTGASINVKGLPASTSGLLLAGDWIEIDGQLKMVTASLNSDAAGLGYLQFSPPLFRAIADNTPIIVNRPMGRFVLAGDAGWTNEPGVFASANIEFEEALA